HLLRPRKFVLFHQVAQREQQLRLIQRRLLDNFLPLRRIVRIFCPHFFELCQGRHVAVFAAQHADVGVRLGLEGAASRAEQRGGEQQRAQQWTCVSDRIQAGTTCSTVWSSH